MSFYFTAIKKANNLWAKGLDAAFSTAEKTSFVEKREETCGLKTTLRKLREFTNTVNEAAQSCESLSEWMDKVNDKDGEFYQSYIDTSAHAATTFVMAFFREEEDSKTYEEYVEMMREAISSELGSNDLITSFNEHAKRGADILGL